MEQYRPENYDRTSRAELTVQVLQKRFKTIPLHSGISLVQGSEEFLKEDDCGVYAFGPLGPDWARMATEIMSWDEVVTPEAGDFVLYLKTPDSIGFEHVGILQENNSVRSKWGQFGDVYEHPLFGVPLEYGNFVKFVREPSAI